MFDRRDRTAFNRQMRYAMYTPGAERTFTARGRPYANDDSFDLFAAVRAYKVTPEPAGRIDTPC